MSEMVLRSMGHRCPTGYRSLQSILSYIDQNDFGNNITIDLRGCVFSYPLAQILEKIVIKTNSAPGGKNIKIIHAYSSAYKDHLAPYLTKKVNYIPHEINTLAGLQKILFEKYQVTLEIIEESYG